MSRPVRCVCGNIISDAPVLQPEQTQPKVAPLTKATAQQAWLALHTYPVEHADDWEEKAARKFYQDWLTTVPSYGCSCKSNWLRYTRDNQPVFKSARGFFDWSVVAHNHVSTHHAEPRKPAITMAEAAAIHGAPWSYV